MDWSKGHDAAVVGKLRKVANELDRMKQLKSGGVESLPHGLKLDVIQMIDDLTRHGLFLVPVGELEQWMDESKVSVSKQEKAAWANAAAAYIRGGEPQKDGVWTFVKLVAEFLRG